MAAVIKPSTSAPGMALFYITIGVLMTIWSGVWYFMVTPEGKVAQGICVGLLLTGIALIAIGLSIGRIGRKAREADLVPGHPATPGEVGASRAAH